MASAEHLAKVIADELERQGTWIGYGDAGTETDGGRYPVAGSINIMELAKVILAARP